MTLNILTFIGFVLLLYTVFHGIRFYVLLQESKKLVAKSQAFQQNIGIGSPRILVAGDSTAVGTGAPPRGSTAGHFGSHYPKASIQNISRNGMRTAELTQKFSTLKSNSFDLIVLQIGANDILHGTQIDSFSKSLTLLFQEANRVGEHVVALHSGNIGLAPLFPWPISAMMQSRTLAYRKIYKAAAIEYGIFYVDLYEKASNNPFKNTKRFYAPDGLHLTADGYEFWYNEIQKTLQKEEVRL